MVVFFLFVYLCKLKLFKKMKKILFKTEEKPTVNFEDLNDDSIVGFEDRYGKKLIVRTPEGFKSITDEVVDLRHRWKKPTLKEYVASVKEFVDYKVEAFYQFDTVKDALKWMSE